MHVLTRLVPMLGLVLATGCNAADADITHRVAQRLDREGVPATQYTVTTHHRVVVLRGVVASQLERDRLERATREVDNVLAIDNGLVVEKPVDITSAELGEDPVDGVLADTIRSRLVEHGIEDVRVDVRHRVVTFIGRVSEDERSRTLDIGNDVMRGNGSVRDSMIVTEPPR